MKKKKKTTAKPKTVDGYLAKLSPDKRAALEQLRRTIHRTIPKAEECISYQLPAFRLNGRVVVWMGAGAKHCAFYPGGGVAAFKAELADYETSKGTIRFQPDQPLPAALVRKLIKGRLDRLWACGPDVQ
jgi:uncharacterized protein YdhG (YjbR/CyaY superfamily)